MWIFQVLCFAMYTRLHKRKLVHRAQYVNHGFQIFFFCENPKAFSWHLGDHNLVPVVQAFFD